MTQKRDEQPIQVIDLQELQRDTLNANLGSERGQDMISESLKSYGAGRSVLVDRVGRLIAGNKTVQAAQAAGLSEALLIKSDGRRLIVVQRDDLDMDADIAARELALADNRTGEVSLTWSPDALAQLEDLGVSMGKFWTPDEWDALMAFDQPDADQGAEDQEVEVDNLTDKAREDCRVQSGDIWVLRAPDGREFRLACGDSTCSDTVDLLLQDTVPDLLLTDPPYGIRRDKGFDVSACSLSSSLTRDRPDAQHKRIGRRQYQGGWDNERPLADAFALHLSRARQAIIWGGNFFADILPLGKHWLVWDKQNTMPSFSDCELAWTNVPNRTSVKKYDVLLNGLIGREPERYHPTQKPVKLFRLLVEDYTDEGNVCYDPYLGSGTTFIAALHTNRTAYGFEIDPVFCEVILQRCEHEGVTCELLARREMQGAAHES